MRNAPQRGEEIGATAIQIFTKQPNRWAERTLQPDDIEAYRAGVREVGVEWACAHDSYLINLATPDETLRARSYAAFVGEVRRAAELGLDGVVTHPGNATDGDPDRGIEQNARLVGLALEEIEGDTMVFFETTAGSGSVLGARFEELARLIDGVPEAVRRRVGVCLDTCHVFAAGYDLVGDYDGVIEEFDRVVGLGRLRVIHLNDSRNGLGTRKDRHQHIGEGELGDAPFRRLMNDPRLAEVPKVLETPKEKDPVANDRRNLATLRGFMD